MFVADKAQALDENKSAIGLRAAINILDKWGAGVTQTSSVLRISASTFASVQSKEDTDWSTSFDADVMQRISLVLNIHSALRSIFDNPDNVYGFAGMRNDNYFFNGRSPLEVMAQGDLVSLHETFRCIDSLRHTTL